MSVYPLLATEYSRRHGDKSLSFSVIRTLLSIACKHCITTSIDAGVSSVMVGMRVHVLAGNVVSTESNVVVNSCNRSSESSQLTRASLMRSFKNMRSASDIMTRGKSGKIDSTSSPSSVVSIKAWASRCS